MLNITHKLLMETKKEARIKSLKLMNQKILDTGDEMIYDRWLMCGVPDEATEDDYEFIAENDSEFKDVVDLYHRIMNDIEEGVYDYE